MYAPQPTRPYPERVISGPQIKAARALLEMEQAELARRAGISQTALSNIERGKATPLVTTAERIVRALEAAGCEIADTNQISQARGLGVRLKE